MPELDLFGHPLPAPADLRQDGGRRRLGYASRPGTGPRKQRCNTCKFCQLVTARGVTSHKCELVAPKWDHSEATDIKPRAPACQDWERKPWRDPATSLSSTIT